MSSSGKIKKLFARANITVHSEFDNKVINTALSELGEAGQENFTPDVSGKFTKKPIIRFATAALIIIAAILVITFSQKQTSTAYAIEQTIKAMRNVTTIHCFMNTSMDESYEVWVEVEPKTGEFKNIYLNSSEATKVATPTGISAYYKNTNKVSYFKQNSSLYYKIYFKPLIEDMAYVAKSDTDSKVNIVEGKDDESLITVTLDKDESTLEWKVDAETKLPISMSLISKEVLLPIKFVHSIYDFSYDVPLPEGIFDFRIPSGNGLK